ncbi:phage tail sheath family protein [Streptomyces sp. AV19]|uniref:phage tail sheath family protein n=1 Tax=Streptomyces sp. AV19 TaxID=2793068 RepID=UPI0018FE5D8C|nr:phage tail sheath subtilisin-like domain-containing protein [Streptomyces sp. AV19]MBH1938530.1 phage tail sheath family protein [Streptomyces sp. AV19]MDG4535179.1 phage tail sheath subtilisin-like domain-containing protein [Streptomyces sp. AV19]
MSQRQLNEPRTTTATRPRVPETRVPGTHLREADGGTRAVHGTRASVTAFVGDVQGLPDEPVFVRGPREFTEFLVSVGAGGKAPSFVREAVLGHFRNGGGGAWILGTAGGGDRVAAYRSALAGLEHVPGITLVVAPDLWRVEDDAHAIAESIAEHCRRLGDRFALLHTRQGLAPADVKDALFELPEPVAQFAAVYYPWITVTGTDGDERPVPASGHVSGLYCRTDAERGVHRAPVGALLGVVKHERDLSDGEQEAIGGPGVNCLRSVPGQGIRVAGARTLSVDPAWTHIGVRRLVNHARESLEQATRWAASGPDDVQLAARVRQSATEFLTGLWREGALLGRSADQAFSLVCDESNNSPEDMARGTLHLDAGLAALRPAEFITFRIRQTFGDTEA